MRTNFSEEALELLMVARRASIRMMDPVIKEELVFRALIDMQHPLWLILKSRFHLNEIEMKNSITDDLLKNGSDDPSKPENTNKLKVYLDTANEEAKKDGSSLIDPYHLVKAIFLTTDNGIVKIFKAMFYKIEDVTEELEKASFSDLVKVIQKNREAKLNAAPRQIQRATEQLYSGLQSDTQLTQFGRNLNQLAEAGKLDPVYFRDEEIKTAIEILCRKQQNNPLLVGEAGVGKTAIVEGIAQLIVSGKVPEAIKKSEIIEISITSLVAGTTLRGQFEDRIKNIIDECAKNPNVILFIDEIHMIVGAGGDKGLGDAANIFKPALARGSLRCIGATTTKENNQFIEKDKALKRRFEQVFVREPNIQQTIAILKKCKNRFEDFHGVKITDEAVRAAAEYADEYIKDKYFPGKAIDLLDHACAREKIDPDSDKVVVGEEVASVVAKIAQIPITQVLSGEAKDIGILKERIAERVIGQDDAIGELIDVIYLSKAGMTIDRNKPAGVILFVGPAGVGKTEIAKSLAKSLLGDESRLFTLDMTEFKDASSVNRLLGAPPGYVGYEQESQLVSCIRSNPNSIILLDDIEKAHPDVLALLKQIFEKGSISTQDGETVFFTSATFILVSNIGSEILKEEDKKLDYNELCEKAKAMLEDEIKKRFRPSFLNSVDKIIYFNPLKYEWMKLIVKNKIDIVMKRLESRGFKVKIDPKIEDLLLDKGYSIRFGARYINKVIEDNLLKPLSGYMLSCCKKDISISLDKNNKPVFSCK